MSGTYRGVKIERSTILFAAVFLLLSLVIFLLLSLVTYGAKSSPEFQITNDPHDQRTPSISGSYVVWVDTRNRNEDIYGFNLETGEEFQITDDPHDQTHPSISGSYVVWEDSRNGNADIYGYNLETQEEFRITRDSSNQKYPDISGTLVVWQDDRHHTNWEIYEHDLSRNVEIRITDNEYDQKCPRVSGNIVVWIDEREGKDSIYGYDISTGREFRICKNETLCRIALFNDTVVFQEWVGSDIFTSALGISTGEKTQIKTGYSQSLDLDGSVVVWSELLMCDSDPPLSGKVLGYDFSSQRRIPISSGNSIKVQPNIHGDFVVWQDNRNGNQDIYGCSLEGVLFRMVHPRPPLDYYYGIVTVICVLGGVLFMEIHPARKIVRNARAAGSHEFRKSLGIIILGAVFAGFWVLYGFFMVYQGSSFGFVYFLFFAPHLALALWHARTPYVLMSQSEITLFEHTLRRPRVIRWEEIQNISFNQKGSRIDLQILDAGLVGIRFCDLGKKEKADILRVLQTRFPSLKEPT